MKIQGNGVFEREGRYFMDPSQVKGWPNAPRGEVGPFDSLALADAAASYVFAHWIETGRLATRDECLAAVVRSGPEGT